MIAFLPVKILKVLATVVANSFQGWLSFPRLQHLRAACYIHSGYACVWISSLVVFKN